MAESLCRDNGDECIARFIKNRDALDKAVASGDPVKIRSLFKDYNRQAIMCFYQVDVSLKNLCEELRKAGEPLALVMRMIE